MTVVVVTMMMTTYDDDTDDYDHGDHDFDEDEYDAMRTLTRFNGSCCVVTTSSTGSLLPWLQNYCNCDNDYHHKSSQLIEMFTYSPSREARYRQSQVNTTIIISIINIIIIIIDHRN